MESAAETKGAPFGSQPGSPRKILPAHLLDAQPLTDDSLRLPLQSDSGSWLLDSSKGRSWFQCSTKTPPHHLPGFPLTSFQGPCWVLETYTMAMRSFKGRQTSSASSSCCGAGSSGDSAATGPIVGWPTCCHPSAG